MPQVDDAPGNAARTRENVPGTLSPTPQRHLCVVTCMDTRIDVLEALDLQLGDAHIMRNAGGIVTDDVIRSLMLSQRGLGTTDIVVLQHTDCAVNKLDEQKVRAEIQDETGIDVPFQLGAFNDLEESVRQGVRRLRESPLLLHRDRIRGYVYDVSSRTVREVSETPGRDVGI